MPIDWDTEHEKVEQDQRDAADRLEELRHKRRAAYLADTERIVRDQPEAVRIALRLLQEQPEHRHERIRQAAEVADLEKLKQCQVMPSGFSVWPFED